MKLKEILRLLFEEAPLSWQESYDNSGLNVGDPEQEVTQALLCIDVTEEVVKEAIEKKCDLIISHHPPIFHGLKQLTPKGHVERAIIRAIKSNIAIVAMHTNLDNSLYGVNKKVADKLGLTNKKILQPQKGRLKKLVTFCPLSKAEEVRNAMFAAGAGKIGDYGACSFNLDGTGTFEAGMESNPYVGEIGKIHQEPETRIETVVPDHLLASSIQAMINAHPYEEVAYDIYPIENTYDKVGSGMLGSLKEAISETELLQLVADTFNTKVVRHTKFLGKKIQNIALCGGAGSFLLKAAKASGADAFITADVKYHEFFDADNSLLLVDAGHYETEQFTKDLIAEILRKKIPNFAVRFSEVNTNAVEYFSNRNL